MTHHPIVLFVYRRPEHSRRTLESLSRCVGASETDLFIFSDGPKSEKDRSDVVSVREVCRGVTGFRSMTIQESETNRGLATSIIAGVSAILDRFGACIVLEDDLLVAPSFLEFLNAALENYRLQSLVFSVSGYSPPTKRVPVEPEGAVWFAPRPSSWGWATWKDRWELIDWSLADVDRLTSEPALRRRLERGGRDLSYFLRLQVRGQLDSWAVRMAWTQAKLDCLTAYPTRSFVINGGLDGSGTHSRPEAEQEIDLSSARLPSYWPKAVEATEPLLRAFRRHYQGTWLERWMFRWAKVQRLLRGRK